MAGYETPLSACTRRPDEIGADGFSSKDRTEQFPAKEAAALGGGGGFELSDGFGSGPTGPGPLDEHSVHPHHRNFIVSSDSACKNQLVVVSVLWPEIYHTIISSDSIGYPRMSASGESSTTKHRLLHASGPHPIPPPDDPNRVGKRVKVRHLSCRVSMMVRVVRTNQYNQDLGLIHSTNGNHLESPNEGSSIDHQVTIYPHAQNITMLPTNETCLRPKVTKLKEEVENSWRLEKEKFPTSSEFESLCTEKACIYFEHDFNGCLAQFWANGYSEEEHPAAFLDMMQALEDTLEAGEVVEEDISGPEAAPILMSVFRLFLYL
ncbi:heat shock 70 kDa protein 17 [Dorcoceras hygrometricum]|uniref:Heat shock 70 kDa protein 17 n=1 Tax=Dorcoceras hygrometricum TaxID=472368 RepID=A0A2Z7CBA3_9LAMI|nr:heat shock 70 kDa protein 17 [Dorcoceras hygrometricum]